MCCFLVINKFMTIRFLPRGIEYLLIMYLDNDRFSKNGVGQDRENRTPGD